MLIEFWLVDAAAYGQSIKNIEWQCSSSTARTFGPSVQLVRPGLTLLGISICSVRTLHSSLSGQSVPSCSAGRPSRGHHWVSQSDVRPACTGCDKSIRRRRDAMRCARGKLRVAKREWRRRTFVRSASGTELPGGSRRRLRQLTGAGLPRRRNNSLSRRSRH